MSVMKSYRFQIKGNRPTTNKNGRTYMYTKARSGPLSLEAMEYFKSKIIKNKEIYYAPSGIYSWILRGNNLYAIKLMSNQEIGTLHFDLDNFTVFKYNDENNIIAAGEFEIKPQIDFNLQSGTYYKNFTRGKSPNNMSDLAEEVKTKLKSFGVQEVEYINDRPIINAANIRTDENNIRILNSYFNKEGGKRRMKRNKTKKRNLNKK